MTGPQRLPDPAPGVSGETTLRTSAGTPVTVAVTLINNAPEPRVLTATAMGVDADWLPRPVRTGVVLPGQGEAVELTITPAIGALPARYPMALAVQALDPITGDATSQPGLTELIVILDAPGQVTVSLHPADTRAVFGKRIEVILRNGGATPADVDLETRTASSTRIALNTPRLRVAPGETVRVGGRIKPQRFRLVGNRNRHTFTITAHSAGAPRQAEGSFTSRAMVGTGPSKVLALAAVVAVWVALAIVYIPKLADHFSNKQSTTTIAQSTSSTAPGQNGSGNGGSGNGGSGNGGSGGGGNGSGGGANGASANDVALNGTISGISPGGVDVNVAPTTFNDATGQGAQPVGVAAATIRQIGKMTSEGLRAATPTDAQNTVQVTSNNDGTWSVPPLPKRGYYLLTFSKAGFQTVRYVIDASSATSAKPLAVTLSPGQGGLSGTVSGPNGPLGAASVTITNGQTTTTTTTNSQGTVGSWSVQGVSTPASYLVTASYNGLSTESQLVTLGASGTASVSLTLKTGVVSISGQVTGTNDGGQIIGLGGATVTATSGAMSRSVTTLTEGGVAGEYILPDLPAGTYTVTISAAGYTPQTSSVTLAQGSSGQTLSAALTPSTAIISGVICGDNDPTGLIGAGLVLSSPTNTYKTTTTSTPSVNTASTDCAAAPTAGAFTFSGVAPGSYQLTSSMFAYAPDTVTVVATAGGRTVVVRALTSLPGGSAVPATSVLTGNAQNAQTLSPLTTPTLTSDWGNECTADGKQDGAPLNAFTLTATVQDTVPGQTTPVTYCDNFGPDEHFTLPDNSGPTALNPNTGLTPGLHTITISAPGYETATTRVQVPANAQLTVPTVSLYPMPKLTGTINRVAATPPTGPTCVWVVTAGGSVPATGCLSTGCPTISPPTPPQQPLVACGTPLDASGNPASTGSYTMLVPYHGNWTVSAVSADPMYNTAAGGTALNGPQLGFGLGATVPYSFTIHRFAQLSAQLLTVSSVGNLQVLTTATTATPAIVSAYGPLNGTNTCPSPTGTPAGTGLVTTSSGTATVDGLAQGVYAVTGGYPSTNPSQTGCTYAYVGLDQIQGISIPLLNPVGAFVGRLVYTENGQQVPAAGVTVNVNGVYAFSGTQGQTRTWTMTTDADGCFAIHSTAKPSNTGACGNIANEDPSPTASDGSQAVGYIPGTSLQTDVLSVSVSQAGFQNYQNGPSAQSSANGPATFTLNALPVPLTSSGTQNTVSVLPDTSALPASTSVAVTRQSDNTSGGITASLIADPSNPQTADLVWHDPTTSQNQVVPGSYNLTFSAPGYWAQQATATLTCTVLPSVGCTLSTPTPTLKKYGAITVNVVNSSNQPVNGAVVTLSNPNGTVGSPQTTANGSGVTFGTLIPDGTTQYTVGVKAAGYAWVASTSALSCTLSGNSVSSIPLLGPGDAPVCTVTVYKLGTITGTVNGIPQLASAIPTHTLVTSPLAGATVTAQLCSGTTTTLTDPIFGGTPTYCTGLAAGSQPFTASAVTDANGNFSITGTTAQQGLEPGTYLVTVTNAPGWCLPSNTAVGTCPQTFPSGAVAGFVAVVGDPTPTPGDVPPSNPVTVQLFEQPAVVSFNATAPQGNHTTPATGLTMTIADPTGYSAYSGNSAAPLQATETPANSGTYVFALVLPGTYIFSASSNVYSLTSHQQAITIGGSPYPFTVSATNNEVKGQITGVQGAALTATGLPGVQVSVVTSTAGCSGTITAVNGTDGNPVQGQTDANGNYDFTNVPNTTGNGQYQVCAVLYGYQTSGSVAFALKNNASSTQSAQLTRITHQVVITVSAPSGDNISGSSNATLTASTTNGPHNATLTNQSVAPVTGSTNQVTVTANNVPFGCWTLSALTLPSGHYGTLGSPSGVTPTDSGLTCGTGEFLVMGTGSPSTAITLNYTLTEYELTINATANTIAPDTAVPAFTLTVTQGATTIFTTTISSPSPGAQAPVSIWLPGGTYSTAVSSTATAGWSYSTPASTTLPATSPPATASVSLSQTGATVNVKVDGATTASPVTVKLTCTSPSNCPGNPATQQDTGSGVSFPGLPVSVTWQVSATVNGGTVTATPTLVNGGNANVLLPSNGTPNYFPATLNVTVTNATSSAPATLTIHCTGGTPTGTTCPTDTQQTVTSATAVSLTGMVPGNYTVTASITGPPPLTTSKTVVLNSGLVTTTSVTPS